MEYHFPQGKDSEPKEEIVAFQASSQVPGPGQRKTCHKSSPFVETPGSNLKYQFRNHQPQLT